MAHPAVQYIEETFSKARIRPVQRVEIDYKGRLIIRNGKGGVVNVWSQEEDQRGIIRMGIDRDMGSGDFNDLARVTQPSGAPFLFFRETDLGVSTPDCVNWERAAPHLIVVVRDQLVIFTRPAHREAGPSLFHPFIEVSRTDLRVVVYGSSQEFHALIQDQLPPA